MVIGYLTYKLLKKKDMESMLSVERIRDHDSFSNKRKLYGVTTLKKVIENKIHFQILFADNFHPRNIDN